MSDDKAPPEPPYQGRPSRIGVGEYAVVVALIGVVAWLGLIGWRKWVELKERPRAEARLRNIGYGISEYRDVWGRFPPPAGPFYFGGQPFSWRVAIEPYLRYDIGLCPALVPTQSWDSPANAGMDDWMPTPFLPLGRKPLPAGYTYYRMFKGGGAAFDKPEGVRLQDLPDPANTILVVEAAEPVFWTQPEGLPYDPDKPLPPLGGTFPDGFYALMADGSVRFIRHDCDKKIIRAYITGNPAPR
jgi:hypothetical protein